MLVPASIKLPKLHVVLLWAMGWDAGHLNEFVFGDINCGMSDPVFPSDPPMLNEARVSLGRAPGALKSFTCIYDHGDNWPHRAKVEKILTPLTSKASTNASSRLNSARQDSRQMSLTKAAVDRGSQ